MMSGQTYPAYECTIAVLSCCHDSVGYHVTLSIGTFTRGC